MHKLWIRRANLNNLNIQGFWYPEPIPGWHRETNC
jgi:hypothetical protein